jgi:AmmeMemoRadiSam system protein A
MIPGTEARPTTSDRLSEEEGRILLRIARESLREHLARHSPPGPAALFSGEPPARLCEPRGAFVTFKRGERLRGCTGFIEPRFPLWEAVRELAVSSASRDFRFSPIAPEEEPEIRIEISVLAPPRPIRPEEVEIGRHGLIVRMRGRAGLLLPQVASEWGWGVEEFLRHTCEKAGLSPDSWKEPDCGLFGFEAQVFREPEPALGHSEAAG